MSSRRTTEVEPRDPPAKSKLGFPKRTVVLVVLMCLLAPVGYRSVIAYQIRRHAWNSAEARQQRDWKGLENSAAKLAYWDPDNALPWVLAAEGAHNRGNHEQAAAYLERLPDSDPRTPAALLELSNIYFKFLNRPEPGEQALVRALELDPRLRDGHQRLVFYYGISMQRIEMVRQAREAIRQRCDQPETYMFLVGADWITFSNGEALNSRWLKGAKNKERFEVAKLINWIGSKGLDEAAEFVEESDSHTKRLAEHEEILRQALTRYPTNPELLAYFLKQAATKGEIDLVAELLSKAPQSAAEDNRFWRFKGWLHAARNELDAAEAAYRKALELNAYDWRSQHELSGVLRRLGKHGQVKPLAERAMEGKDLRKTILQLPDVQSASVELLMRVKKYAEACGDTQVARRLAERAGEASPTLK